MQTISPSDFNEVTRRVKADKKREIFMKMNTITPLELDTLCQVLTTPHLLLNRDSIFYQDDFPYIALRALQEQRISVSDFASLQTLWAKKEEMKPRQPDFKYIPMYKAGKENSEARVYLAKMFQVSAIRPDFFKKSSEQQVNEIYARIASLPAFDQGFWLVAKSDYHRPPIDPSDKYADFARQTITDKIRMITDMHPMCLPSGNLMVISSINLFQVWLNINFSEAVKVNPVLGVSSVNDIREGTLKRHRDLAIPFPGLELPKQADHVSAPSVLDFIFHERYHCLRASQIGAKQTLKYLQIADNYQTLQQNLKTQLDGLNLKISKRKTLVQQFFARTSILSAEQQKQAKIELGQKLYQEQQVIHCLAQIIRFTGQLKFRLYDMEHPNYHAKFHLACIFNVEIHLLSLKSLPNTAKFLPTYIKVLVDHLFAAAGFNRQELSDIAAISRSADKAYAHLSIKDKSFIHAVKKHIETMNKRQIAAKHWLMFELALGLVATSVALTAGGLIPGLASLILCTVLVLMSASLGMFAYQKQMQLMRS